MLIYYLIAVALSVIVVNLLLNHNARARLIKKIPGPRKMFLFGNMIDCIRSPKDMFTWARTLANSANGIYGIWICLLAAVNIYNPEDIEKVIATPKFNEKSLVYKVLEPWLQEGLLVSKGSKWSQRRKILTPAFHFNILREFCVTLEENSFRLVERLKQTSGEAIDIIPVISEYTLNSICETAMGTRFDGAGTANSYKNAIYALGELLLIRFSRAYLLLDFIFNLTSWSKEQKKHLKNLKEFTETVIEERREYFKQNGHNVFQKDNAEDDTFMTSRKKKIAMLDLLILAEKEGTIDRRGIQEEVDTFMFEGHDTTAAGLTYLLLALANSKDIQEKIVAELGEVLGESDELASIDQLNRMRYLDCCIKESLRLYPPVPFISRNLNEEVELKDMFTWARTLANSANGIYGIWICLLAAVNIYNPEDIEKVIATPKFNEKSLVYKVLEPWLQEGLLVSKETAMGTRFDGAGTGNSYKNAIYALGELLLIRFSRAYLLLDFIFNLTSWSKEQKKHLKNLKEFTETVIEERREYFKQNGYNVFQKDNAEDDTFMTSRKKKIAMLDLLILAEKEGTIDRRGVQEEVDTFMFEGHDTTAAGLTYLLLALANRKDIQEKIVAELGEVLGESEEHASIDQLNRMRYLDCCIKESLRLYPPVPFISRNLNEEVELSGFRVPANTWCHIHIFDLHRREDLFKNPLEFNPDRFLPENSVGRHPYSYIPFSAGPRNCIGQKFAILEMKSCVSSILRHFKLEPVTKESELVFIADLVLRNSGPVLVKFVPKV